MSQKMKLGLWILAALFPLVSTPLYAEESVIAKVTVIVASNQGSDFDLENDAFRDQLIQIFSYKSYKQVKEYSIHLEKVKREVLSIPGDYEFVMAYRGQDQGKVRIGALIQKGGRKFLNTEVTIIGTGPIFLGGPPTESGDLLLVIETLP